MRLMVAERQAALGLASLTKASLAPYSTASQRAFLSTTRKLQAKNQVYNS